MHSQELKQTPPKPTTLVIQTSLSKCWAVTNGMWVNPGNFEFVLCARFGAKRARVDPLCVSALLSSTDLAYFIVCLYFAKWPKQKTEFSIGLSLKLHSLCITKWDAKWWTKDRHTRTQTGASVHTCSMYCTITVSLLRGLWLKWGHRKIC